MSGKIIIKNGVIFDGTDGNIRENKTIEIENGNIVYIGDERTTGQEREVIDASGKFIMPGLIDAHMHLSGIINGDTYPRIIEPNLQQAMVAVKEAEQTLAHGFTTVCECSMVGPYLKRVIEKGIVKGPRVLPSGQGFTMGSNPTIDPEGMLSWDFLKENHPWGQPCSGPDELRKGIRELHRMGCDAIKIWATGGGLNPRPKDQDSIYSDEELKAVVDEAGVKGMPIVAHCESTPGTLSALKCGITNVLHGTELDDECIEMMSEKGAFLMPTLKVNLDWVEYYTDEELQKRRDMDKFKGETLQEKEYDRLIKNFQKAYDRGVHIALASDTYCEDTPYGEYGLDEIRTFVHACDVPEKDALLICTRNAARALELDDRLGTIEAGKCADILILDKDVSKNIDDLNKENIKIIMKSGIIC